ncbi:MAG: sigma factor-like helix-turn-helix DNA-binding protein, partial [Litorimonas sp.]
VRRRAGERDLPERDPVPPPGTDLALRQALDGLPETDRLMLELFYVDGFRGREIADALGVPLGTVKSRLFRAREALKTHYMKGDET